MYVRGNSTLFLLLTVRARVGNQTYPGFLAMHKIPLQTAQRDRKFRQKAKTFPAGFNS